MSEKRFTVSFDEIKQRIKHNDTLNPLLKQMVDDGLSEDEAVSIMVEVAMNNIFGG